MSSQEMQEQRDYDISIIRPQVQNEDIQLRAQGLPAPRLKTIKKGLRTLHTLELMAINIYKFQITKKPSNLNRQLIAAMCNEMTHYQDFQVKLYEYGFKPGIFRWSYWIVGFILGFCSQLMGGRAILKVGIWVETKAVRHYGELLRTVNWDDDTRKIVEKNEADEDGHISRWKRLLESGKEKHV